jgi:hypothetical protein
LARSGLLSEPTSKTTPGGGAAASSPRIRGHRHRRRDHDQLVIEGRRAPVGDRGEPVDRAGRIGDLDREALGREEAREPPPHAAGAADHQDPPARARAGGGDAIALLGGQRRADERQHQLLADRRGQATLGGRAAGPLDHVALLAEVADRDPGRGLDPTDLLRQLLAARDGVDQRAIDSGQLGAQVVEIGHGGKVLTVTDGRTPGRRARRPARPSTGGRGDRAGTTARGRWRGGRR